MKPLCLTPDLTTRGLTRGFDRLFLRCRKLPNGCIVRTRRGRLSNYSTYAAYGQTWKSHRLIYQFCVGGLPDELMLCHTCDTPCCVHPLHLFPGTHMDNMADMVAKGRSIRGTQHYRASLSETEVRTIRARIAAGESYTSVGRDYGISGTQAGRIHRRVTWAWLPDEPATETQA